MACDAVPAGAAARRDPALYAFDAELLRVRDIVSDPLPGEVRLQWWRDLVDGEARGGADGNPVAAELERAVTRYSLPRGALASLVEARVQDLYDDAPPSLADLEGRFGETASTLLRLATLILADGGDAGTPDAAGHGGVARGLARLLATLPHEIRRGRLDIPHVLLERHGLERGAILDGGHPAGAQAVILDLVAEGRRHLALAEDLIRTMPATVRPAFLPLALVGPLLDRVAAAGADAFRQPIEIPQWRRQWALWRASRQY